MSNGNGKVGVYDRKTGAELLALNIPMAGSICYDEESDCLLIGRATQTDENGKRVPGSSVIQQHCRVTGRGTWGKWSA